jgi:hypothetical protein
LYRRLVFLFFKCNVKKAYNIPSTETLFITKNERIKQSAKKMGDALSFDDLLDQKENYILHTRARDIMKAWADSHHTDYSGVSLGDLFISFYDIFLPYLKQVYVLEKAVEKYRPSELFSV